MGRNGMGKTTLFKSLIGILPARSGRLELNGADITRTQLTSGWRAGSAYVPQGRMIFPYLTVEENIVTGMEKCADRPCLTYIYDVSRCCTRCASARAEICPAVSSSNWPLRAPW